MSEPVPTSPWWKKSAAPLAATVVLAVCTAVSWSSFHREDLCWGKGGGQGMAELLTLGLGVVALLTLALSWTTAHMSGSRAATVTCWVFAAVTVLLGLGVALIGQSPNCD